MPSFCVGGARPGELDLAGAQPERARADGIERPGADVLDEELVASAQAPDGTPVAGSRLWRRRRTVKIEARRPAVRGGRLGEEVRHQSVHPPRTRADDSRDVLAVAPVGGEAHQDAVQLAGSGRHRSRGHGVVLEDPGALVGADRGQRGADPSPPGDDGGAHESSRSRVGDPPGPPRLVERSGHARLHLGREQLHRAVKGDEIVEAAAVVESDRLGAVLDQLLPQQIGLAIGQVAHLGAHPGRRNRADRHRGGLEGELAELDAHLLERQAGPQLFVGGAGGKERPRDDRSMSG